MASLNRKIVAQAILAPNGGAAISSVRTVVLCCFRLNIIPPA